jgi:hypothetical protein
VGAPPSATIALVDGADVLASATSLGSMVEPRLSVDDVLYWRSDLF